MPNPPNPRTWVDGEIPPYDVVNQEVYDTLSFLLEPPMVKLRQTTPQSIPNSTNTALTWGGEDVDPYSWHSPTVNPTRITPTFPGWYRGWWSLGYPSSTGGNFRIGWVQLNGVGTTARARRDSKPSPSGLTKRIAGVPFFLAMNGTTDYIEIMTLQDTGSALSTTTEPHALCEMFLRFWAPL